MLLSSPKWILIILSSRTMVFDVEALRHAVLKVYPEAVIFFESGSGRPVNSVVAPRKVDLTIDLTGPRERGALTSLWRKRRRTLHLIGRRGCCLREFFYHVLAPVEKQPGVSSVLERERMAQESVLSLVAVSIEKGAS